MPIILIAQDAVPTAQYAKEIRISVLPALLVASLKLSYKSTTLRLALGSVFECAIKLFMEIQIMEQGPMYVCLAILHAKCAQVFLSLAPNA